MLAYCLKYSKVHDDKIPLKNRAHFRQSEEFFKHAEDPPANAEITYGERREHCFTGDTEHPNAAGSRTVHQRYMPAMAQWMIRTAPAGADTRSWVY